MTQTFPSYKLKAWYRRVASDLGRFHGRDIDESPAKCPLQGRDTAVHSVEWALNGR